MYTQSANVAMITAQQEVLSKKQNFEQLPVPVVMAAPVDTNSVGEGGTEDNTIRGWMVKNGVSLLDDTYSKLQEHGFVNMFVSLTYHVWFCEHVWYVAYIDHV